MISISAAVDSHLGAHDVTVTTNQSSRPLAVAPKPNGAGSSVNGGEFLFLALATCYCNDIYREAAERGMTVRGVRVSVYGEFDEAPGSPAEQVVYDARVEAEAGETAILDLMRHTDTVAEIQNTLRRGMPVTLRHLEAVTVRP